MNNEKRLRKKSLFLCILLVKQKSFMGYVYLIEDPHSNTFKIGVTRNKNSARISALQTGNSSKLKLLYIYKTEYPFRLETMLHTKFKDKHILNEWYELDIDDIQNFEQTCDQLNNIIISLKDNYFFSKKLK